MDKKYDGIEFEVTKMSNQYDSRRLFIQLFNSLVDVIDLFRVVPFEAFLG